jgi:hypothetical protein
MIMKFLIGDFGRLSHRLALTELVEASHFEFTPTEHVASHLPMVTSAGSVTGQTLVEVSHSVLFLTLEQ